MSQTKINPSQLDIDKTDLDLGNVTNDAQLKAADLDTDTTLAANSDSKIASQQAVKAYVDAHAGGGSGIDSLVEDTTPQLGGDLDPNSHAVGDATAADLTKLHGITATVTELNSTDGVTSAIQTQLDAKFASANVVDEDDMSGDSATKVPTQQSVKAYVDANAGGGMTNPMTAEGDIIYGGTSGAATRLAKGTDDQVLTLASGVPAWADAPSGGGGSGGTDWHIIATGYESADSMASSHSGGTDTFTTNQYYTLNSGASTGNYSQVYRRPTTKFRSADISLPLQGGWILQVQPSFSVDGASHLRFISSASNATTGTAQQIGIVQTHTTGTTTASSSTGDGTTEETATISGLSMAYNEQVRYSMTFDGSTVDFYVDGVLKNTHTTNIPLTTGSTARPYMSLVRLTTNGAGAQLLYLSSFMLKMPLFS